MSSLNSFPRISRLSQILPDGHFQCCGSWFIWICIRIRIQLFKWIRTRIRIRVLMTNIEKNTAEKIICFWSKIPIYLSLGLHKGRQSYAKTDEKNCREAFTSQKRTSSDPALKKIKFTNFFYLCGSFLPSWIWIQSGSTTLSKCLTGTKVEGNRHLPFPLLYPHPTVSEFFIFSSVLENYKAKEGVIRQGTRVRSTVSGWRSCGRWRTGSISPAGSSTPSAGLCPTPRPTADRFSTTSQRWE